MALLSLINNYMHVGFLLFEQFNGKLNIGSSRIRGHALIKHWQDEPHALQSTAESYRMGRKYDVLIYQKVYWIEHAKDFPGIKILDICDADFLHWGHRVKQMADLCQAVTTSTEALAEYMRKLTDRPVFYIPDRVDLDEIGELKKDHKGKGEAKTAAWFGYSENYPMLDMAVNSLVRNGFTDLLVIADRRHPYQLPPSARHKLTLTNMPWTPETVLRDLLQADIIINPKLYTGKWKYKSNNKTLTGWALGLPVAHIEQEIKAFLPESARIAEGDNRYREIREQWNVLQSVKELKELIVKLNNVRQ